MSSDMVSVTTGIICAQDHILPMGFRDALKLGANRSAPQRHSSNYDKDCSKEYGPNGRRGKQNDLPVDCDVCHHYSTTYPMYVCVF